MAGVLTRGEGTRMQAGEGSDPCSFLGSHSRQVPQQPGRDQGFQHPQFQGPATLQIPWNSS